MMAARSLIQVFRVLNPSMLKKKDRVRRAAPSSSVPFFKCNDNSRASLALSLLSPSRVVCLLALLLAAPSHRARAPLPYPTIP